MKTKKVFLIGDDGKVYKKENGKTRKVKSVKIHKSKNNPVLDTDKGILLVKVGIENLWDPDPAELDPLAELFVHALTNPGCAVVVRTGIEVEYVDVPRKVKVRTMDKS